jgi:serine/threonine protein kinase
MDTGRWERIKELFAAACKLSPRERGAYLDEHCPDVDLRREVEALLEAGLGETIAGARHDSFMVVPATSAVPSDPSSAPTRFVSHPPQPFDVPKRIGRYRIVRKLGEGGMGIVFEAEQTEPVKRRVALKLIKPGMDSARVIARFDTERQALALMDHENVARVLDAGATEDGRPYFVMDYVAGVPITEYCDTNKLSTSERLELFLRICDGVHHAHQKGVIHRDLKPSNILVELHDGKPRPKIIDFGVAKATEQRHSELEMFTEFGMIIGTPEYMSPEQANPTTLDIDTRTDIYSLGVVLYELLVGQLPIDAREMRRAGYDAMRRKIQDEIPSRPSTRLTTYDDTSSTTAQNRRASLASLIRQLRGDLDWITMKALEKDRTRRYRSAAEFADDVRRHIRSEPVIAGPPRLGYRVSKFYRRHRIAVGVAASFALLLLAGVTGTSFGLVKAIEAREIAEYEAETSREVIEFMSEVFDVENYAVPGDVVTAKEVLDQGADQVRFGFEGRPRLQGRMMEVLGVIYRYLGLYDASLRLLEDSLATRRRALGDTHPDVALSQSAIAGVYIESGRIDSAADHLQQALAIQERTLGRDDPERARTLNNLGAVALRRQEWERARDYWEQALAIRLAAYGPEHLEVAKMLGNLSVAYAQLGDLERGRDAVERAIRIRQKQQHPDHPDIAKLRQRLSVQLSAAGEYEAALDQAERALAIQRKVLEESNPRIGYTLVAVGRAKEGLGDLAGAVQAVEQAIAIHAVHETRSGRRPTQLRSRLLELERKAGANEALARTVEEQLPALAVHGDEPWIESAAEELARALRVLGRETEALDVERRFGTQS